MALAFTLLSTRTRKIHKFNVQGRDYRLAVDRLPDNITHLEAVALVHNVIERKYSMHMQTRVRYDMLCILVSIDIITVIE